MASDEFKSGGVQTGDHPLIEKIFSGKKRRKKNLCYLE
jgi:hypothetical protein